MSFTDKFGGASGKATDHELAAAHLSQDPFNLGARSPPNIGPSTRL